MYVLIAHVLGQKVPLFQRKTHDFWIGKNYIVSYSSCSFLLTPFKHDILVQLDPILPAVFWGGG